MNIKLLSVALLFCLIGVFFGLFGFSAPSSTQENSGKVAIAKTDTTNIFYRPTHSGSYLSGRFAQQHHDWKSANTYMQHIISSDETDVQLLLRAMVLSMGSGNPETAISIADKIIVIEPSNSLALLFLSSAAFKNGHYDTAVTYIKKTPSGGISDFIMPILESWANAAQGIQNTSGLTNNPAHIYHSILIADYMGDHENIQNQLKAALNNDNIEIKDMERIADIYAHINQTEKALQIYKKIRLEALDNKDIESKINTLEAGKPLKIFDSVASPVEGVALALFETAQSLIQEYSDDSAQVFSNMALYLDPDMIDAKLLLAYIAARYKRYEEAISYYKNISPDYEHYLEAKREAASLWENIENYDAALLELKALIDNYDDLQSIIESGNIYRRTERYKDAITLYNKAAATFGDAIPEDYWHIYYLRGMAYERSGEWEKAEADLQQALSYQPNHPLVLNYLGYAWADKGNNLEKALDMISKASVLRPSDGFITDSLGWVLYKMARYEDSVPHLEKAVELMPYDPTINDHLGDAYWRVGRKLEANFQWKRALNFSKDDELIDNIKEKLSRGLPQNPKIKEARTNQ